jgi:hypothetical protein
VRIYRNLNLAALERKVLWFIARSLLDSVSIDCWPAGAWEASNLNSNWSPTQKGSSLTPIATHTRARAALKRLNQRLSFCARKPLNVFLVDEKGQGDDFLVFLGMNPNWREDVMAPTFNGKLTRTLFRGAAHAVWPYDMLTICEYLRRYIRRSVEKNGD